MVTARHLCEELALGGRVGAVAPLRHSPSPGSVSITVSDVDAIATFDAVTRCHAKEATGRNAQTSMSKATCSWMWSTARCEPRRRACVYTKRGDE